MKTSSHFLSAPHLRLSCRARRLTRVLQLARCRPRCRMNARWWSFLFGLVCVRAEGTRWTASQSPASIRRVEINSSLEISCSTSLPRVLSLSLHRLFKSDAQIVYLSLNDGEITKQNPRADYVDRVRVTGERSESEYQVTLRLSELQQDDTDLYYCSWTYTEAYAVEHLRSNGTVLIVGEKRPEPRCQMPPLDLVLVCAGTTASVLILCFCGVYFYRGRRVRTKGNFIPARPPGQTDPPDTDPAAATPTPPRSNRI
ncbi:hypothetical protein OJAV_G00187100 [Oryzias javanicus]|uniref:Immunoglobulin V-set domain-containing protein n=1 Tax=Oryzias javanicus TaxID=123683 RepID=A0A437CA36_ORYJA|nr:hypothetical protein OJAV_G00187100 [Oryzias javanicus]